MGTIIDSPTLKRLRDAEEEVERLHRRIDGLLRANNWEVERRREAQRQIELLEVEASYRRGILLQQAQEIRTLKEEARNWREVAERFAEPYHCGSDCPCYAPDEGPVEPFVSFPQCWQAKPATS